MVRSPYRKAAAAERGREFTAHPVYGAGSARVPRQRILRAPKFSGCVRYVSRPHMAGLF